MEEFISKWSGALTALVWIAVTFALGAAITVVLKKKARKKADKIETQYLVSVLIVAVWVIVIAIALSFVPGSSNVISAVISGSGVVAIVIGLAAQDSASNIIAGFILAREKPYDIGDRIRLIGDDETAGYVESITLRQTVIRTITNIHIIIPNSVMNTSKIENSSYRDGTSYPIEVTIAYEGRDKRYEALRIMEDVIINHPKFYDKRTEDEKTRGVKAAEGLCAGFEDSGITLRIFMTTRDFADSLTSCSECRMQILDRFEDAGIEIPYNKLTVFLPKTEEMADRPSDM